MVFRHDNLPESAKTAAITTPLTPPPEESMDAPDKQETPSAPPPEESMDAPNKQEITSSVPSNRKVSEWMLTDEDEDFKVAALKLPKLHVREQHAEKLRIFVDTVLPGYNISSSNSDGPNHAWKPLAVRQMPAPPPMEVDIATHNARFSEAFLLKQLGGKQWSPGFFFVPHGPHGEEPKIKAYWLMAAAIEPYLPKQPNEHGAKLTAFFNNCTLDTTGQAPTEDDYMNAPVFIREPYQKQYRYYGHYSPTRFSDKLDYERMIDGTVPPLLLEVWAKTLSGPREEWLTEALKEHFWPKPTYDGPLPLAISDPSITSGSKEPASQSEASAAYERRVQRAIQDYMLELQAWQVESKSKVEDLTEQDIMTAFHAADAAELPGIRFHWEYMQSVGYRPELYDTLFRTGMDEMRRQKIAASAAAAAAAAPKGEWRMKNVPCFSESGHDTTKAVKYWYSYSPKAKTKAPEKVEGSADSARKDSLANDKSALPTNDSKDAKTKNTAHGSASSKPAAGKDSESTKVLLPHQRDVQRGKEQAAASSSSSVFSAASTSDADKSPKSTKAPLPHERAIQQGKQRAEASASKASSSSSVSSAPSTSDAGKAQNTKALFPHQRAMQSGRAAAQRVGPSASNAASSVSSASGASTNALPPHLRPHHRKQAAAQQTDASTPTHAKQDTDSTKIVDMSEKPKKVFPQGDLELARKMAREQTKAKPGRGR